MSAVPSSNLIEEYLAECRAFVLDELRALVPARSRYGPELYDLMLDYPLRAAKGLRPAVCIATCRCLGGTLEGVLKSAATLELYHNAFLIHDDVEDGSEKRRDEPTLHRLHGVPVAVNVGDGMLALALTPLLENTRLLGLGKALAILQCVSRMARESAEGQALELSWIHGARFLVREHDYFRMVHKKTSWYSFIAPMRIGGLVANVEESRLRLLGTIAALLGVAFQIQDDILNLTAEERAYGKELGGDLWEGKHTLILAHALATCSAADRERALGVLRKPRPRATGQSTLSAEIRSLRAEGVLDDAAFSRLEPLLAEPAPEKTPDDVAFLARLVERQGSIAYAQRAAAVRARRASRLLAQLTRAPSVHLRFLQLLSEFVTSRAR
ncbi:MAG TPA: polyprenyl synthetase family protein [Polyangiaceae bacterium]|nr:polyprenyl synthetase family protein [Polyangiaceae bacterium]